MENLLKQELLKYHALFSEEALAAGLPFFELIEYKAKDILLQTGEVAEYLYLANDSLSRCFFMDADGDEQTVWIKPERTFFTDFKSFVSQTPSMVGLQLYEDTQAYRIRRDDLNKLYSQHIDWAQFGIKLTEHLHVALIDVFITLQTNDATKNYQYIEYMFPRFLQVAPLKDIASMLQISPVSLSRIRSGTQTKRPTS